MTIEVKVFNGDDHVATALYDLNGRGKRFGVKQAYKQTVTTFKDWTHVVMTVHKERENVDDPAEEAVRE